MAQSTEDKSAIAAADFAKLVDDYLTDLYSRYPSIAFASGLHAWDSQLEDLSGFAIAAEVSAIKKFQSRLEKIRPLALALSDVFDYQILASNMNARLLELEVIRSRERNPLIYSRIISTALLQLAMFEHAHADARLRHVIAKQKLIPRLLSSARANIDRVPPVYLKVAKESFKGTLSFIQTELPKAFTSVKDARLESEFKKTNLKAAEAVAKYIKHLEQTKPDPSVPFAIGKRNYEAKLRSDEGIDIPLDALLRIATRELARTQGEFRKTAASIAPGRDPFQTWAEVRKDHPKAGTLVAEAQKQLEAIVRFIEEKKILTLPVKEHPVVARTPDFMRHATASMWMPGPFESRAALARYLITDVDPKWSDREKEEYLASLNYAQLWSTSIHEAYPGHYVQGAYLKQVASPLRKVWAIAPGSFVEGWAHYAEQMMIEEGFGAGDPKMKLGMLADALLRLSRFVVGIRLHTDGMSVDEATQFFMENAFMSATPARIEAERGTFDPTYLVYSVGKLALLKMREDYRRYRGAEFSLQEFHDRLLTNGNAPLWAHRRMLMPGERGKLIE